jgi:hypothetical protein
MPMANVRLLRIAVVAAVTGAFVLGATAASARNNSAAAAAPVVSVGVTTAGGVSVQPTVQAGNVTFQYSQQDGDEHALQMFRLKPGGSLPAVLQGFSDALAADFATRAIGVQAIDHGATLFGGALILPGHAISVTLAVDPGTYYFIDYSDFGVITPRVATMEAVGQFQNSSLPQFDSVVVANMPHHQMRFAVTQTSMSATGTFKFVNASDEDHEVVFRPTRDGITDDYVSEFYVAVLAGTPRPPTPWIGIQHGLNPVSPGLWAIVQIDLASGPHALICYVPSDETGHPHGYEGMHVMVNLS